MPSIFYNTYHNILNSLFHTFISFYLDYFHSTLWVGWRRVPLVYWQNYPFSDDHLSAALSNHRKLLFCINFFQIYLYHVIDYIFNSFIHCCKVTLNLPVTRKNTRQIRSIIQGKQTNIFIIYFDKFFRNNKQNQHFSAVTWNGWRVLSLFNTKQIRPNTWWKGGFVIHTG